MRGGWIRWEIDVEEGGRLGMRKNLFHVVGSTMAGVYAVNGGSG